MALEMATRAAGHAPEALDVQVLQGLDTFLATERFLCKLEQARAEWMDLSNHVHSAACAAGPVVGPAAPPNAAAPAAAAALHAHPLPRPASSNASSDDDEVYAAARAASGAPPAAADGNPLEGSAAADGGEPPSPTAAAAAAQHAAEAVALEHPEAAAAAAAAVGDYVVVSKEDAVEAMAYYIAQYIARLPEAQRMGPKELQSALKETFAILRHSRWRLVWSWGRLLYRSAAVSFSALQLYNNPWLLRAVLSALWASSKMLYYGQMV